MSSQAVFLLPWDYLYLMKKRRVIHVQINTEFKHCQVKCYRDEHLHSQEWGTICQGSARRHFGRIAHNSLEEWIMDVKGWMKLERDEGWMKTWAFWVSVPVTFHHTDKQTKYSRSLSSSYPWKQIFNST